MQISIFIKKFVGPISLIYILTGCGVGFDSFGTSELELLSTQCLSRKAQKLYADTGIQSFQKKKVIIASKFIRSNSTKIDQQKSSTTSFHINTATPMAAIIDNNCSKTSDKESFSRRLVALSPHKARSGLQVFPLHLDKNTNLAELIDRVNRDSCIIRLTDNPEIKMIHLAVDPRMDEQMEYLTPIKAETSWDQFFSPSIGIKEDVIVAVVDTGVNYNHPDLKNMMWQKNGKYGKDTVNDDDDPKDDQGHGTMVSGFIAAESENGIGITGLMKANIKIMAVKALNSAGSGSAASVADAIIWATDNGAEVINISLGGKGDVNSASVQPVDDAIDYALGKNVIIINAAGNDSMNVDNDGFWPAHNGNKPGYLVVAATNAPNRTIASFSNYGTSRVHIAAPGASAANASGILSTTMNNSYGRARGTSFSSPIVAGAAALAIGLIKSRGDQISNTFIKQLLVDSATVVDDLKTRVKNGKYLNLEALATMTNNLSTTMIIEQPVDQHILISENTTLSVKSSSNDVTYQWYKNNVPIPGATTANYDISKGSFTDRGQYTVKIKQPGKAEKESTVATVSVYAKLCEE